MKEASNPLLHVFCRLVDTFADLELQAYIYHCLRAGGPQDNDLKTAAEDVYNSTRGMIFFGAPHTARSLGGWRSILKRIHSVAQEYNDYVGAWNISVPNQEALLNDLFFFRIRNWPPKYITVLLL